MNFEAELQERVSGIEAILRQYLPAEEGYQKTVLEAMNYSVLADAGSLPAVWRKRPPGGAFYGCN